MRSPVEDIRAAVDVEDTEESESAPSYTVFPALVMGLGDHGRAVVRRLQHRLRDEDPRLLEVVRLGALSLRDTMLELEIMDPLADAPAFAHVANRTVAEALDAGEGSFKEELQRLCDSVGVHEPVEILAEDGYTTFIHDQDLHVRAYVVADLTDGPAADGVYPMANALRAGFRHRGSIACTALCMENDRSEDAPFEAAGPLNQADATFDYIYLTGRIKQFGFLASGPEELITAHQLFLEAMILSNAEQQLQIDGAATPAIGTFGVAAIRLDTEELDDRLCARLAAHVISAGYLAPAPEGEALDSTRAQEETFRERWRARLVDLSTEDCSVRRREVLPVVALPENGELVRWCTQMIAARGADGKEATPAIFGLDRATAPIWDVLAGLQERIDRRGARVREEMTADLRNYLSHIPGSVMLAETALSRWQHAIGQEAELYRTADARPERADEIAGWLQAEVDGAAYAMRRARSESTPALAVVTRAAFVGLLIGLVRGAVAHTSDLDVGVTVLVALGCAIGWLVLRERRWRRQHARLVAQAVRGLEARLGVWVRQQMLAVLLDLFDWCEAARLAAVRLEGEMGDLLLRYRARLQHARHNSGSFLEQVLIPDERAELMFTGLRDTVLEHESIVQLPAPFLLPITPREPGMPYRFSNASTDLGEALHAAVRQVAQAQLQQLHELSLEDVLAPDDHAGGDASETNQALNARVEQLHQRALPLHQFPTADENSNGHRENVPLDDWPSVDGADLHQALKASTFVLAQKNSRWDRVSRDKLTGPDHLVLVRYAGDQSVLYVRVALSPAPILRGAR